MGALPPSASAGQVSRLPRPPWAPALFSLAHLLGWGQPALCPGDASPVRVCLLSLLCGFPAQLTLPAAAVRCLSPYRDSGQPPPPVASGLAPRNLPAKPCKFLEPPSPISGRIWGNGRLNPSRNEVGGVPGKHGGSGRGCWIPAF